MLTKSEKQLIKEYAIKLIGKRKLDGNSLTESASNSDLTIAFLKWVDPKMKEDILKNIANHYGISKQEAFEEITDEEAESIMDYLTEPTRRSVSLFFNKFKSRR